MKKYFGWPEEICIFLCLLCFTASVYGSISPAEISMNNIMQYTPDLKSGDVPMVIRPGVSGPSGMKGTNLATAAQMNSITQAVDVLNANRLIVNVPDHFTNAVFTAKPAKYNGHYDYVMTNGIYTHQIYFALAGLWKMTINPDLHIYTNLSISYNAPETGWLDKTGSPVGIVITNSLGAVYAEEKARIEADLTISDQLESKTDTNTTALLQAQIDGLANNGTFLYNCPTTNTINTNYFNLCSTLNPKFSRTYTGITNNQYLGGLMTEEKYTRINGPAVLNVYLERTSGTAVSIKPELYFSYTGTDGWFGDFDAQPQAISTGTNLYTFVIHFPQQVATNTSGIYVRRMLKATSAVNGSLVVHGGTGTPSSVSFMIPSATSGLITSTNQVLYFTDVIDGTNIVKAGLRFSATSNQFYFVTVTNAP